MRGVDTLSYYGREFRHAAATFIEHVASPKFAHTVGGILVGQMFKQIIPLKDGPIRDTCEKVVTKFAKHLFKSMSPDFANAKPGKSSLAHHVYVALAGATGAIGILLVLNVVVETVKLGLLDPSLNSPYPAMTIMSVSFFFLVMHVTNQKKADPRDVPRD